LLHDFVRESRNQIQRFLRDVHQTNRAVPHLRVRDDIRNQMFRKSVAACSDKYDLCHFLSPDISLITIIKCIDFYIQNQMPYLFISSPYILPQRQKYFGCGLKGREGLLEGLRPSNSSPA
jgi:hypothetical protein